MSAREKRATLQHERRGRPNRRTLLIAVALGCATTFFGPPANAQQVVDGDGLIHSSQWLVLGPFRHAVACSDSADALMQNFVAPTAIPCAFPRLGDEADYDPFEAASIEYIGPLSDSFLPLWRQFDDGSDNGDNNLNADTGYRCGRGEDHQCADVVSWLVTYVEYSGAEPIDVELCVGADDGAQLWWDRELVLNNIECRRRELCQNIRAMRVTPGVHRVAVASIGGRESWGVTFGLRRRGVPITDSTPGWTFHGISRPDGLVEPNCSRVVFPVTLEGCQMQRTGNLAVNWRNPDGAAANQGISIRIDEREVMSVAGDATTAVVANRELPANGEFELCVLNASGLSDCCRLKRLDPVSIDRCLRRPDGGIELQWRNPLNADSEQVLSIFINGDLARTVPGNTTSTVFARGDLPTPLNEVCIENEAAEIDCCHPERTDESGFIATKNWLVLGPFTQTIQCNGRERDSDLLRNYVAPTRIECQYPRLGDRIGYSPDEAVSFGYIGPTAEDELPFWRLLNDDTPDTGDTDLTRDPGFLEPEGAVSFAATYIEYTGRDPVEIGLCMAFDDGGQVWIDDQLVFNRNQCGVREVCEYTANATIVPGMHRILVGTFNASDAAIASDTWGFSLGLEIEGERITSVPEFFPDWIFHGRQRPLTEFPCTSESIEICDNGFDDDGDLLVDCADPECAAQCGQTTRFRRGDSNADAVVDLSDPIFTLKHLFASGEEPSCLKSADTNDDGVLDLAAAVFLLNHLFVSGEAPGPPFTECGFDPTSDDLSCTSFPPCE